jgi:hypothetical protein
MATTVIIIDRGPNEIMEIVRELREQGLIQGKDFDFAYHQARYDVNSYDAVENRKTIFTFHTEKYATFYIKVLKMKSTSDPLKKFQGRGLVQITGRNTGKSYWTNVAIKRLTDDIMSKPIEALICSEGKVYGARYYCVEPIGGQWYEMEEWCVKTFGSAGEHIWGEKKAPKPGYRWYMNNRKFWFREQKDRDWFVIRWNS